MERWALSKASPHLTSSCWNKLPKISDLKQGSGLSCSAILDAVQASGNRTSKTTEKSGRLWSKGHFCWLQAGSLEWEGAHISPENWRCICSRWNYILPKRELCFCAQNKEQHSNSWRKIYETREIWGEIIHAHGNSGMVHAKSQSNLSAKDTRWTQNLCDAIPFKNLYLLKMLKNWCFQTMVLEKTLESLLDNKELNQSILKEISSEYSLEGLMLKLKLLYFGHLIQRADSLEKTLMIGKIESRKRMGWQRLRWLDSIIDSVDVSLSKLLRDGEGWRSLACCNPWSCKDSDTT